MNKYYLIDIEILKKKNLKSSKYIELPKWENLIIKTKT